MKTRVRQLPNCKWVAEVKKGFIFKRWYPITYVWGRLEVLGPRDYQRCWWTRLEDAQSTEKDYIALHGK